jgi:parallel beta-helix repeat protein
MLRRRSSLSVISLLITLLLAFLSISLSSGQITISSSLSSTNKSISQRYINHDPIKITNNNELAAVANSGSGTALDPYIITNWNITGAAVHGIYITGIKKHFRIQNCFIGYSNNHGIFVENVPPGLTTITHNICNDNRYSSIRLSSTNDSIIANNTCSSNVGTGISLFRSYSSIVANNTCKNNSMTGISLGSSKISNLANNTCNHNDNYGIFVSSSGAATVINNTCNHNEQGIHLIFSNSSTVTNNTSNNNNWIGIYLYRSDSSIVGNNTCNHNHEYGLYFGNSFTSSTIINNTCQNNGEDAIFWEFERTFPPTTTPTPILIRIGLVLSLIGLLLVILFLHRDDRR